MYELRDYQNEIVDIAERMQVGEKVLITIPTGTGKTVCFAKIATNANGKILIVVPSTELRIQAIEKIKKIDENADVGSVQANINELDHKIVIATRQSLSHKKSNRIEKMLDGGEFEYVIFDEVHLAVSQVKMILHKLNDDIKVIGFTATPYNAELKDIFKEVAYHRTILDMIEKNYLCQPRAIKIETDVDLSSVKSVAGEFIQAYLENEINTLERNNLIVKAWKEYASDRKHTIIFCSGVEHSNDVMEAFKKDNIACKTINSKNDKDDRKQILDSFKNGQYPIITNCNILTTGFDFEALDCIILASPTQSKTKYVQQIGRGLRLYEDKADCLIIDMQDTCSTHNLVSMDDIFNVTIKSGETLKEAQDRNEKELEEEAERQRLRELLEQQRQDQIKLMKAKEIELFNTDMDSAFTEKAYYHWWKLNTNIFVLSVKSNNHYLIDRDCTKFNIYDVCTENGFNSMELIYSCDDILEAIDYVENQLSLKATSFMLQPYFGSWKTELPTEKQQQAIKYATVYNKWDVHIYFTKWKIKQILKVLVDNPDIE